MIQMGAQYLESTISFLKWKEMNICLERISIHLNPYHAQVEYILF